MSKKKNDNISFEIENEPWKKIRSPHKPEKEEIPKNKYQRRKKHKKNWKDIVDE